MLCLGELSVAMPETGAFHVYASRYLGPATGYAVAWLYWLTWTVALGSSPHRRRILHAVLVPAVAGVAVVPDLLRGHFPA